jgi:murein DD-endopeptidase MepM/ murein hydrolase activator NlpD
MVSRARRLVVERALVVVTAILGVATPLIASAQPVSSRFELAPGLECPLGRVATVRGGDSEASEGGGFHAARKRGIHGAVDLNGWVGEAVFAVANGKVVVAERNGERKIGKNVVLDHRDGGFTTYGHLHTIEVTLGSNVVAGQMLGTIGYTGNAAGLQTKRLPAHLHFAYARRLDRKAAVRDSPSLDIAHDFVGVLDPKWAVKLVKCWEDASPAARSQR